MLLILFDVIHKLLLIIIINITYCTNELFLGKW